MEIEVTVTMRDLAEVGAEIAEMIEETKRKMLSGEIEPDPPEVEPPMVSSGGGGSRRVPPLSVPCDCVGCSPHLGPEIPCERVTDGTEEK